MLNIRVLLLTISLLLACGSCANVPSVIIVGAGAAGIAAATKLLENGITNITILEAEPRIGGRINSVKFGDSIIDLGAQWCHGEKNNIVFELANDLNLLAPTNFNRISYASSPNVVGQSLTNELYELFDEIYNEERTGKVSLGEDNVSTGEYITSNFVFLPYLFFFLLNFLWLCCDIYFFRYSDLFPVTKWWSGDTSTAIALHWYENDRLKLPQEFTKGPNDNGHSWLENFSAVLGVDENPNVLSAWFLGKFIPQIELISDEILIEGIVFALNKFMGHEFNITKPDHIARSKWYTNPHFRGVYSFETVQSRKRSVSSESILSEPLTSSNGKQTLLFAGEATNPIHYSTVHGAIETGYREANRIIQFYK